jgi:hypothetical protein
MRRRQTRFLSARFQPFLICLGFPLVLSGCGDGKIRTYPVTGTVHVDGKPAGGAIVIFCPTDGSAQFKRERPFGTADADGKFGLTTFIAKDGAPAGDYRVMVRWPAPRKASAASDDSERQSAASFDRFNGKYLNPDQSGLTAKVGDGPTELPPFELKPK